LIPKEKQKPLTEAETASSNNSHNAASAKKIRIDGVDVNRGIMMTGGTVKNYLETLSVFYSDGFEKIKEIKKSLETDNLASYVIYVHALKGASASLGAAELSESAKALEMAGKREDYKFIHANNAKLIEELETLLYNIGKIISADGDDAPKNLSVNKEELRSQLMKLKSALDDFDFTVIDGIVSRLQNFTQVENIGSVIKIILQNILIGGYDEAVSLIDDLLDKI
jgi:HPt (histidine-containing phosphotransfer) domain-containing protein